MAIVRGRGAYSTGYFGPLQGTSPYAKTGGEIVQYVSNGANPNDAVGGTYRVHIFDTAGDYLLTFDRDGYVDVLVVGGGGAGGAGYNNTPGGGGGGGGLVQQYGLGVQAGSYPIRVGEGGTIRYDVTTGQQNGMDSFFGAITAFGGGGGSNGNTANSYSGGSGGGAGATVTGGGSGVLGQGFAGGSNTAGLNRGAGGGGAGQAGTSITGTTSSGNGGNGLAVAFYSNESIYYAGGGAGALYLASQAALPVGGLGGGGNVGINEADGLPGTFYGAGGGGGASNTTNYNPGGAGYNGIVMVRYRIY